VLGGTLTYSGNSQGAVNAGSYTIIPGGLTSSNYTITFDPGTLTTLASGVDDFNESGDENIRWDKQRGRLGGCDRGSTLRY